MKHLAVIVLSALLGGCAVYSSQPVYVTPSPTYYVAPAPVVYYGYDYRYGHPYPYRHPYRYPYPYYRRGYWY